MNFSQRGGPAGSSTFNVQRSTLNFQGARADAFVGPRLLTASDGPISTPRSTDLLQRSKLNVGKQRAHSTWTLSRCEYLPPQDAPTFTLRQ
jgi:hypothetical protein